ncbi:hypothetical protein H4S06_003726, partial [Coemansia sp. BCRC 34490]
ANPIAEDLVDLGNELHVSIFNTVVYHLDKVACTAFADPVAARCTVRRLGSNSLEDGFEMRPRIGVATRHKARAIASTFLATRNAAPDKQNVLGSQLHVAALGVGIVRVAAINDNIALLKVRQQLLNELVNRRTGLDKKHDLPRTLQLGNKLLDRVSSDNLRVLCLVLEEMVNL